MITDACVPLSRLPDLIAEVRLYVGSYLGPYITSNITPIYCRISSPRCAPV